MTSLFLAAKHVAKHRSLSGVSAASKAAAARSGSICGPADGDGDGGAAENEDDLLFAAEVGEEGAGLPSPSCATECLKSRSAAEYPPASVRSAGARSLALPFFPPSPLGRSIWCASVTHARSLTRRAPSRRVVRWNATPRTRRSSASCSRPSPSSEVRSHARFRARRFCAPVRPRSIAPIPYPRHSAPSFVDARLARASFPCDSSRPAAFGRSARCRSFGRRRVVAITHRCVSGVFRPRSWSSPSPRTTPYQHLRRALRGDDRTRARR